MIYIISNCTSAKKIIPNQLNLFRNYNNIVENIVLSWKNNLNNSNINIEAKELYKGVTWKAVLDCEKEFSIKFQTRLLIASAGYGLIDSKKIISPYGITFSKNKLDSVNKYFLNETWWTYINEFSIFEFKNSSAIFICLSKEYIEATKKYIEELINLYTNKVFIINITKNSDLKFKRNYLNFDNRFNSYEPGTLINLSQRALRWLSQEIVRNNLELNHITLQKHINIFLNQFNYIPLKKGKRIQDLELKIIIKNIILEEKIYSATKALSNLRQKGFSCEQIRFKNLFNSLKKEVFSNER